MMSDGFKQYHFAHKGVVEEGLREVSLGRIVSDCARRVEVCRSAQRVGAMTPWRVVTLGKREPEESRHQGTPHRSRLQRRRLEIRSTMCIVEWSLISEVGHCSVASVSCQ